MNEESDSIGRVAAIGAAEPAAGHDRSSADAHLASAGVAPKAAAQKVGQQLSPQQMQAAVRQANVQLASVNRVLALHVDVATGLTIATISNSQTGEILQQFPSDGGVRFAQMLAAWSPGKNLMLDLLA